MKQRIISVIVCLAMLLTMLPAPTFAVTTVSSQSNGSDFAGGTGIATDPYLIETKEHLNNARNDLDAYYKLIADITFTDADFAIGGDFYNNGNGWMPIGSSTTSPFAGSFDGNGKSIKGLQIKITASVIVYAGLFGCCSGGNITNLTMDGGSIEVRGSTEVYAGGICAYSANTNFVGCNSANNLEVIVHAESTGVEPYSYVGGISGYGGNCTNCENSGNITTEVKVYNDDYDFAYCGGIVGGYSGTISNCSNYGDISAGSTSTWTVACIDLGGIAGSTSKTISGCENFGNISCSANNMTSVYAGGICGSFSGTSLELSYNAGIITGPHAGGIAGSLRHGAISNCYNLGEIISSDYAGGIVGYVTYNGEVHNCYNVGMLNGSDSSVYIGGITGYMSSGISANCYFIDTITGGTGRGSAITVKLSADEMRQNNSYTGFDFVDIWEFKEKNHYLYPTLIDNPYFDGDFAGGSGTEEDPYLISTKEHLNNVRNYLSAHFKMTNDIEFTDADFAEGGTFYNDGAGWVPIDKFEGIFDGNHYAIKNLYVRRTSSFAGLFGKLYLVTASFKNIVLLDCDIEGTTCVGGIAGEVSTLDNDYVTFENCYVSGNIIGSGDRAGGICGSYRFNFSRAEAFDVSAFTQCYNAANISGSSNAGGIVGYTYSNKCYADVLLSKCCNKGEIRANKAVGGIIGYCVGYEHSSGTTTYYSGTIVSNSYNAGNITANGTEPYAGGIVGRCGDGSLRIPQTYSVGIVNDGNVDGYTSGLVGQQAQAGSYYKEGFFLRINENQKNDTYGYAKTSAELKNQSTYVDWDFEAVWTMGGSLDYPYPELRCFTLQGTPQILGNCRYLSTVTADFVTDEAVQKTIQYKWYVDGVEVADRPSYTLIANDVGKKLKLEVISNHPLRHSSVCSEEILVGKASQPATPTIPELLYLSDNKFEIRTVSTQEYSIDNVNWQTSGVFENLDPNKTYTVYSRILENELYLLGESTEVLSVGTDRRPLSGKVSITGTARYGDTLAANVSALLPTGATFSYEWKSDGEIVGTDSTYTITQADIGKNIVLYVKGTDDYIGTISSAAVVATKTTVQIPNAPVVADKTNNTVTLVEKAGYEYSLDKIMWQDSPMFTGLSAATEYTFYQRVKETDTTFASKVSNGTKETTLKNTVAAPEKPVIKTITNTSVTLVSIDGYEYSMDGLKWQTSNVFTGLKPYTEYSFCQRIAENNTDYASAQSSYTIIITLKNTVAAPGAPTIEKATATSVTLVDIAGYEYSIDGKTWQTSNVFSGLTTLETYTFYQRIKETNTDYTSAVSAGTSFKVKNVASAPAAPTLTEKANNKIVVAVKTGYEYSINKTAWNTTGVFTGLQPNQTYTVYCRIPETDTHYASEVSSALTVTTLKNTVAKPGAPVVSSKTSTSVTLVSVAGAEYSKDGTTWQTSNVFTGLSPAKTYTFYQRVAETSTAYASEKSAGLSVTIPKNTVSAPSAPTLSAKTSSSVTLVKTSGYEYSKDGTTWQTSNVFENLSPNTTYVFYQRLAETSIAYASEKSAGLTVITSKNTVATPAAPVLNDVSATIVVLNAKNGYEYSKDGTTWQDSNIFTGLKADTQYSFYQRTKETSTTYASAASPALKVKTAEKSACSIKAVAPIIAEFTTNKIVLVEREGYEYKIGNGAWTTNTTFSGLSANTSYTVYQRIVETDEEYASAASVGVTIKTAEEPRGTTTEDNYYKLQQYINTYGVTDDDGYKNIIIRDTGDNGTEYYFVMGNRNDGIYFDILTASNASTRLGTTTEFTLSPSSKYITVQSTEVYYYQGSVADTIQDGFLIDRSKYTKGQTLTSYKSGVAGIISSSGFSQVTTSAMKLLCTYWDYYIYSTLGFGLKALGFTSFEGEGSYACDLPSGFHYGGPVWRNERDAGCMIDGYTGDCYCIGCGEKISSGRSIAAKGSHSYTNSCDKDCNTCGEEQRVVHTYTGGCDVECNICSHTRIAVAEHSFNEQKTCTVCGTNETFTIVFKNWDGTVISTKNYHWGDTVTAPINPTKPADKTYSYTFKGWDKAIVACSGDATYTATYTQAYVDYTVVFKDWNGTVLSSKTYHWGDKINIPANPTRPNNSCYEYTFTGWDKEVVNCAGNATYTAVYSTKTLLPTAITSSMYKVSGGVISKVPMGTTVGDLLENLNEGQFMKVYTDNKEIAANALVGTGMVVKIMSENTTVVSATIIVTGDINGDGKITITDMLAAKSHILKKNTLTGVAANAADTNNDGTISITDFIQIKASVLGKGTITPH